MSFSCFLYKARRLILEVPYRRYLYLFYFHVFCYRDATHYEATIIHLSVNPKEALYVKYRSRQQ